MKITRRELRTIVESVLKEDRSMIHTVTQGDTLSSIYSTIIGQELSDKQIQYLVDAQNKRVTDGDTSLSHIESANDINIGDEILAPGEQTAMRVMNLK